MKKFLEFCMSYKIYIIFFVLFSILNGMIDLKIGNDDTKLLDIVIDKSVFDAVIHRALTRQPRIFSDFFQAIMYNSIFLWSILNSLFLTICLYLFERIILLNVYIKNINYLRIVLIGLFFCIYPYVITSGILWYTGSFHYLWPFTMMMIGLTSFIYYIYGKEIKSRILKFFIIIGSWGACYNEQPMAILFVFGLFTILYIYILRKRFYGFLFLLLSSITINISIYLFLSQYGNRGVIVYQFFPDFDMLNIFERIYNGINFTHSHYINNSNIILIILTALIMYLYRINNQNIRNGFINGIVSIPFIYYILNIVPLNAITSEIWKNSNYTYSWTYEKNYALFDDALNKFFYQIQEVNPVNVEINVFDLMPTFFSLFIMLFIISILFFILKDINDKFTYILIICAALMSGYVNGFSPAIVYSGNRVFLIGNMLFVLIIGKLCSIVIYNHENKEAIINDKTMSKDTIGFGLYNYMPIIILTWICIVYVTYIVKYVNGVLWF